MINRHRILNPDSPSSSDTAMVLLGLLGIALMGWVIELAVAVAPPVVTAVALAMAVIAVTSRGTR